MEHALQMYAALERLDAADAELEELERRVHGMAVTTTSLQAEVVRLRLEAARLRNPVLQQRVQRYASTQGASTSGS